MIKYGVISVKNLLDDLENWSTLYVSGRLFNLIQRFCKQMRRT